MDWKRAISVLVFALVAVAAGAALYFSFCEPAAAPPRSTPMASVAPAAKKAGSHYDDPDAASVPPAPEEVPPAPDAGAPPEPDPTGTTDPAANSGDGLLTRGKLEKWLTRHGFSADAHRENWKKERPDSGEVKALVTLLGAQDYSPMNPSPMDADECFEIASVFVQVRYPPREWGGQAEETPHRPLALEVMIRPALLPTTDTLVIPSLEVAPDRVRAVLLAEGFTSDDQKRYVRAHSTLKEAQLMATRLTCSLFEINLETPPNDPVNLYGIEGEYGRVGVRVQKLTRADWLAKRGDAPLQMEVFLHFGGLGNFPEENPHPPPVTVDRAKAVLKAAGFVEQPPGVFTCDAHYCAVDLAFARLGLGPWVNGAKVGEWDGNATAVQKELGLQVRQLSWSIFTMGYEGDRTLYTAVFGTMPMPDPPPAERGKDRKKAGQ